MANEPLKHLLRTDNQPLYVAVAEMFMANEPLKQRIPNLDTLDQIALQRCLWRMSH